MLTIYYSGCVPKAGQVSIGRANFKSSENFAATACARGVTLSSVEAGETGAICPMVFQFIWRGSGVAKSLPMWFRLVTILPILAALSVALFRYTQPAATNGSAAVEEARTKILGLRGEWTKVARGDFEIAVQEDGELRPVIVTSLTFL